ncbi:MAG: magnesium transporter [Patescibacteria group bacterium]
MVNRLDLKNKDNHQAQNWATNKVPTFEPSITAGEVRKKLEWSGNGYDSVNYIYLIGQSNQLTGVVSVKDVLKADKDTSLAKLISKDKPLIKIKTTDDREKAVLLVVKHKLKGIPVVTPDGRFVGAIVSDTVMEILHDEHTEDLLKTGGVLGSTKVTIDLLEAPVSLYFKKRAPWLLLGLMGGLLAAGIIGIFEEMLAEIVLIAAFLPAVVYMADAVGAQSQVIFVRSLTIGNGWSLFGYIRREIMVGLLLGSSIGLLSFILISFFWGNLLAGLVLGLSFLLTTTIAVGIGLFMPWIFWRLGADPAVTAGPFTTLLSDIVSIVVYLSVA